VQSRRTDVSRSTYLGKRNTIPRQCHKYGSANARPLKKVAVLNLSSFHGINRVPHKLMHKCTECFLTS